ncbi:hypothetical protein C882_0139 [Caenispirillum salinarum AK4]|uniref:Uncharacterized protein n=1 Tax=Caenispirillum salinarum AK4 TaxID=1238182 RepID=K9HI26_9PROT|nr:hypothetical protein C882_0139 [Caenispirillum salinarum AK4]
MPGLNACPPTGGTAHAAARHPRPGSDALPDGAGRLLARPHG